MHDTTEKIYAYLNSRHTSGLTDSLGREKPFFNIVVAAVNIWYRATDIDRANITIRPDNSSTVIAALMATILIQDWMRRARFGVFLNKWGRTLSEYGSAVCKFVVKNGEIVASVVPWNRLIVDPVDSSALPRIEKFYKTPAQLQNMATPGHPDYAGFDLKVVENLKNALTSRKTTGRINKDSQNQFIELWEVHGELPIALLKDEDKRKDKDWNQFTQQMHTVTYVQTKKGRDAEYEDFTLFKGKEKRDPYILTHLIEEDGRTLAIGAVEYLFDAQWMQNHTIKNMKDTLDLSSKLLFQTADSNYLNRNVLTAVESGDILIHGVNMQLTQVNNSKPDITQLQNFSAQWKMLAQELTATPDSLRGVTPPSGTPYSTVAALTQNANSLFEIMTENKGLALEDIFRTFVIPYLKKKMDTKEEVVAILNDYQIKKIDGMYVPNEAIRRYNQQAFEEIVSGNIPQAFDQITEEDKIKKELANMGNERVFSPEDISWKEVVKDLEWKFDFGVTSEPGDKQAALTTLSTLIQSIDPVKLQDPFIKSMFIKILNWAGVVSPAELTQMSSMPQPVMPAQGMMPASNGTRTTPVPIQ